MITWKSTRYCFEAVQSDSLSSYDYKVANHPKNLEKLGNLTLVREKSGKLGKVRAIVVCLCCATAYTADAIGRTASEDVVLELIKSKCVPCLMYLNKSQLSSLDCSLECI